MHDSHKRSVIKGVTWRLTGTLDTAILSWFFTGNAGISLQIAGAEFLSKIGLYYLHERLWMRLNTGRKRIRMANGSFAFAETRWRSLSKGVSWRITGTLDTIFWASVITGNIQTGLKIGGTELLTKILLYYLHERCWLKISWGLRPHNLIPVETIQETALIGDAEKTR
jgi:uncharacterized membrane protein